MGIMEERRAEVLKYDYWQCRICSGVIDAGTAVGDDVHKTRVLIAHINDEHRDNPAVDPNLHDDNRVLYFKGIAQGK
jgi:hypothetical protein